MEYPILHCTVAFAVTFSTIFLKLHQIGLDPIPKKLKLFIYTYLVQEAKNGCFGIIYLKNCFLVYLHRY